MTPPNFSAWAKNPRSRGLSTITPILYPERAAVHTEEKRGKCLNKRRPRFTNLFAFEPPGDSFSERMRFPPPSFRRVITPKAWVCEEYEISEFGVNRLRFLFHTHTHARALSLSLSLSLSSRFLSYAHTARSLSLSHNSFCRTPSSSSSAVQQTHPHGWPSLSLSRH